MGMFNEYVILYGCVKLYTKCIQMLISNQSMLIHHYVWSNLAVFIIQTCLLLHHIQICRLSHAAANSYWILQVEWLPKSRAVQMPEVVSITALLFSCHWYIQTGPHIVLNCVGQASIAWQLYNALHSMYIPFISQLKPHNSPDLSRLTVHILKR
jgi:hypothetical protein